MYREQINIRIEISLYLNTHKHALDKYLPVTSIEPTTTSLVDMVTNNMLSRLYLVSVSRGIDYENELKKVDTKIYILGYVML